MTRRPSPPSDRPSSFSMRLRVGLGACLGALLLSLSPGCEEASAATPAQAEPVVSADKASPSAMGMTRDEGRQLSVATERAPAASARLRELPAAAQAEAVPAEPAPIPAAREPLEIRTAKQRLTVRIAPDHGAPRRARIPMRESFEVFEYVEGTGCGGKGWADVGNGGFVCTKDSRRTSQAPRTMPPVKGDGVMPFYFAKIEKGESARRWKSMESYLAGDEPRTITAPGRDFAFVSRLRAGGQIVLVDKRGRVMPEQDLRRFQPSDFQGHDLLAAPVPEGQRLAWAVRWPETTVYASPDEQGEVHDVLEYHTEIFVEPEPVRTAQGTFYALVDGGYLHHKDLRRVEPVAELSEEVPEDEVWIDVELDQQVLTVMRGSTPVYVTLVSSGLKGPTPHGLFRINKKQAYGAMSSAPGAADPYAVEAVPYVQYFHGGIALHSAYWHNRFGYRVSHGCVNLSPRDAAHVYSLTSPHPRGGWMEVYEGEGELGTRVRVHDGDERIADRRTPVEHVFG